MNWTLEVVSVPVSDVERAKSFYADQLGFAVDHDTRLSDVAGALDEGVEDVRFVQLTPHGSGCSIVIGAPGLEMAPGSLQGLQLVVPDLPAARAELVERGVQVSEIQVFEGGSARPSREGDALDNVGFVFFKDPDGNGWGVQQISARG
jgi:catechol 2,3-dioxygenase-like lactoylglutathione lyase family enzyme